MRLEIDFAKGKDRLKLLKRNEKTSWRGPPLNTILLHFCTFDFLQLGAAQIKKWGSITEEREIKEASKVNFLTEN